MVDSADHITGKTGLSPTVTISKNGAAFASPAGAVTELSGGWYKVAGNATDSATLGPLLLHATAAGADPCDMQFEIVAFDPEDVVRLGLTTLPNVAQGNAGQLPTADNSGKVLLQATQTGVTIPTVTAITNDVGITQAGADKVWNSASRTLSAFGFTVTVSTNNDKSGYSLSSAGVQAIWDALTSALTTVGSVGKLLTDNINATISSRSSHTAAQAAAAVRTELTTELARIDAAISSRGTLTAQQVWEYATRTLSAFGFEVTVATNNDKTGYTLTATPPTAAQTATAVRTELATELARIDENVSAAKTLTSGERSSIATAIWSAVTRTITGGSLTTAPPTAAQIASAVWDSLTTALTTVGSIGKRLADNVDAKISEVSGGGGTGGSGAYAVTTTVLDADAVPIAGAAVRLRNLTSNDVANTDVDGLATLNKDAGTYTRVVTAAGYEAFTDTVVVDGDETLSDVELTAIVIAPATSDDQCNCYLDAKDAAGTLQGGVTHLFRLSTLPTGDGSSYGPLIEATSEDDETSEDFGRLEVLLKRGATYLMQRGETWENESADQVTVEVPNNAGPFELPNVWSNDN